MKKFLTLFLILLSISLLGASCKKSGDQTPPEGPYEINIPVVLNTDNVTKAMNIASEKLGWPYAAGTPNYFKKAGSNWIIKPTEKDKQYVFSVRQIELDSSWEILTKDQCLSDTTPVKITGPVSGNACYSYNSILIHLDGNWIIGIFSPSNTFEEVKKDLDHFLNNLE